MDHVQENWEKVDIYSKLTSGNIILIKINFDIKDE